MRPEPGERTGKTRTGGTGRPERPASSYDYSRSESEDAARSQRRGQGVDIARAAGERRRDRSGRQDDTIEG